MKLLAKISLGFTLLTSPIAAEGLPDAVNDSWRNFDRVWSQRTKDGVTVLVESTANGKKFNHLEFSFAAGLAKLIQKSNGVELLEIRGGSHCLTAKKTPQGVWGLREMVRTDEGENPATWAESYRAYGPYGDQLAASLSELLDRGKLVEVQVVADSPSAVILEFELPYGWDFASDGPSMSLQKVIVEANESTNWLPSRLTSERNRAGSTFSVTTLYQYADSNKFTEQLVDESGSVKSQNQVTIKDVPIDLKEFDPATYGFAIVAEPSILSWKPIWLVIAGFILILGAVFLRRRSVVRSDG